MFAKLKSWWNCFAYWTKQQTATGIAFVLAFAGIMLTLYFGIGTVNLPKDVTEILNNINEKINAMYAFVVPAKPEEHHPVHSEQNLFIYSLSDSAVLHDFSERLTARLQNAGFEVVNDKPAVGLMIEVHNLTATRPDPPSRGRGMWATIAAVEITIHGLKDAARPFTTTGKSDTPEGSIVAAENQLADMALEFIHSEIK